jgi:hypothetical protein
MPQRPRRARRSGCQMPAFNDQGRFLGSFAPFKNHFSPSQHGGVLDAYERAARKRITPARSDSPSPQPWSCRRSPGDSRGETPRPHAASRRPGQHRRSPEALVCRRPIRPARSSVAGARITCPVRRHSRGLGWGRFVKPMGRSIRDPGPLPGLRRAVRLGRTVQFYERQSSRCSEPRGLG